MPLSDTSIESNFRGVPSISASSIVGQISASALGLGSANSNMVLGVNSSNQPQWRRRFTEIEIDFGSTIPVREASFVIIDSSVLSSSRINVVASGNPATGRGIDDYLWDSLILTADPANGQFTLFAVAVPGPIVGKRNIIYGVN